jgi:hypothetical protein
VDPLSFFAWYKEGYPEPNFRAVFCPTFHPLPEEEFHHLIPSELSYTPFIKKELEFYSTSPKNNSSY